MHTHPPGLGRRPRLIRNSITRDSSKALFPMPPNTFLCGFNSARGAIISSTKLFLLFIGEGLVCGCPPGPNEQDISLTKGHALFRCHFLEMREGNGLVGEWVVRESLGLDV